MRTAEGSVSASLGDRDRVAIIAGGGRLPRELADVLSASGHPPLMVIAEGEANADARLTEFDHIVLALERYGDLTSLLRKAGATHVVLAGTIERRPALRALHWNLGLLKLLPKVVAALAAGDDAILKAIVRHIEDEGFVVLGAHQILPDLLSTEATISQGRPGPSDDRDIAAGFEAAKAIGALDIGQAAVAIGGRVVALEGIEGTDGLLERVAGLRSHGRISGSRGGVLVKCAKPGQELRADLPTIGPSTVERAHAAGLNGIAVEAGRSIILQQALVAERADRLGLFVSGVREPGQ